MVESYNSKHYIHFDDKFKFRSNIESYVYDFKNNPRHSFLPLIYSELTFEKYKSIDYSSHEGYVKRNGKIVPVKEKKRPIMYASHLDNFIYKHYGIELNELYNTQLKNNDFDESVIAYRSSTDKNNNIHTGKSNIHFAAEIINYISENDGCYIYIGDYSNFFDTLNHKYLKEMISLLYSKNSIPNHQFEIFKSLTKYSFIFREDIDKYFEELGKVPRHKYFSNMKEFREFKKMKTKVDGLSGNILRKNNDIKGIPQGTAISAIYSNIYMQEIDKYINELVKKYSGIYRRYSDDFIIVIPKISKSNFMSINHELKNKIEKTASLELHSEKTMLLQYKTKKIIDLKKDKPYKLDYLGFIFDGKTVKMREKSITKYYRTAYKLVDKGRIVSQNKNHARLTYKRKVYQGYHQLGERTDYKYNYNRRRYGTFITYANKCQKIFDQISPKTDNLMKTQIKNHKRNISRKIRRELKKIV